LARLISNVKEDRAEWRVMGMFVETCMDNALPKSGYGACRDGSQNCPLNIVNVALMDEQFWRPDQTTAPYWVPSRFMSVDRFRCSVRRTRPRLSGSWIYPALGLNGQITTFEKFRRRNAFLWLAQSSGNTAMRYHDPQTVSDCEGVMIREDVPGSMWASVLAILSVTGTIGALYLPLVLN
jgi:hypothetical protein